MAQDKPVAAELLPGEPPPCIFAGGARQRQTFRGRLGPVQFGFTCKKVAEPGTLSLLTAGFLLLPPLMTRYFLRPFDDRTDDCAFGADDVASGPKSRKLRFQMIADTMWCILWNFSDSDSSAFFSWPQYVSPPMNWTAFAYPIYDGKRALSQHKGLCLHRIPRQR